MYVAVKGGERAIANAHALLAKQGRGDPGLPGLDPAVVAGQLGHLVSRVMAEGSLYDPALAARAIVQAQGDVLEAVTLVRSYRTTLPRFGYTLPVDTAGLPPQRRISATFKDLPGGQQLGATFDYTHRLFTDRDTSGPQPDPGAGAEEDMPRVSDLLGASALLERAEAPDGADPEPGDLTRDPV
ncbi:MAG TPA: carbon-phosphorus lyase complex subunit PhnI, partial [Trebonia sp.]|nr:carbon-phosphorus lyase complex subunit PhnI [Trebonia sp.]